MKTILLFVLLLPLASPINGQQWHTLAIPLPLIVDHYPSTSEFITASKKIPKTPFAAEIINEVIDQSNHKHYFTQCLLIEWDKALWIRDSDPSACRVDIYDKEGQMVFRLEQKSLPSRYDLSTLGAGQYYFVVFDNSDQPLYSNQLKIGKRSIDH